MVLVLGTTHTPIIHTPIIISAFLNFTFSPTNIHFSSEIIKSTYIKPISVPCTTFYDSLQPPNQTGALHLFAPAFFYILPQLITLPITRAIFDVDLDPPSLPA
jgi:hypothetical protein